MTIAQILAANPTAILLELVDPYGKTLRYQIEDEDGQRYCEPPSDAKLRAGYRFIYRRKMGREVV